MWDLYNESEKISKTSFKELLNKEITNTTMMKCIFVYVIYVNMVMNRSNQ